MSRLKWGTVAVVGTLACGALFALAQKEASAGAKVYVGVVINTSMRYAIGALSSARNDSSNIEYIYCQTYAGQGGDYVICGAKTAGSSSVTAGCFSQDPSLIDEARSATGDSRLEFDWDSAGTCTIIGVQQDSRYEPKL